MRVIFQTIARKLFALCEYSLNASSLNASMFSTFFYRCRSVALELVRYKRNSLNASSLNANLTVVQILRLSVDNFLHFIARETLKEVLMQRDAQLSDNPIQAAVDGVAFIANHFRQQNEDQKVCNFAYAHTNITQRAGERGLAIHCASAGSFFPLDLQLYVSVRHINHCTTRAHYT